MARLSRTADRARRGHYAADLLNNAISVGARLVAGVGVFVVMARYMGPSAFGEFMFAMAVATLAAFATTLGFVPLTLREVAANPKEAIAIEDTVASAKMSLAAGTIALTCIALPALGTLGPLLLMLLIAQIIDGAIDWLFAVQKVHGQFAQEARFMTAASLFHSIFLVAVALHWPSPIPIAGAFLASKSTQFCWVLLLTCRIGRLPLPRASLRAQWRQVIASKAYTMDVGLGVITSQSDTVLVRLWFGSHAAGLYQAGMRVVTGLQAFSSVAGNVFLPRLASALESPAQFYAVAKQVRRVYGALTLVVSVGVLLIGYALTRVGYGAEFTELNSLWPWFAAVIAVRVWSAIYGLQLTAVGAQAFRSIVNLCAVSGGALGMWFASYANFGLKGVLLALLASAVLIMGAYRWKITALRTGSPR